MHVRGKSGAEFSADSKKVLLTHFRPCSYLTVFQDSGLDGYLLCIASTSRYHPVLASTLVYNKNPNLKS